VHRVGVPCDNTNHPIIIQFTMRNFRNKIWKVSRENVILKEKKLMLKEDLTHTLTGWKETGCGHLWKQLENKGNVLVSVVPTLTLKGKT